VSDFSELFDGRSIFAKDRWPYRIAVLQNGPDTPIEFSIIKGEEHLQVRYLQPRDIYKQTLMEVISMQTSESSTLSETLAETVARCFPQALDPLLRTPVK
jgi:hypothetical protein